MITKKKWRNSKTNTNTISRWVSRNGSVNSRKLSRNRTSSFNFTISFMLRLIWLISCKIWLTSSSTKPMLQQCTLVNWWRQKDKLVMKMMTKRTLMKRRRRSYTSWMQRRDTNSWLTKHSNKIKVWLLMYLRKMNLFKKTNPPSMMMATPFRQILHPLRSFQNLSTLRK